ncbi:MAG: hypothetical protein E6G79_11830, partial [Alphaproteobacteria bacterium]
MAGLLRLRRLRRTRNEIKTCLRLECFGTPEAPFTVVPEPVGSKLVNSLARPGGNITGLTNIASEIAAKRVQLLKEAFPGMKRLQTRSERLWLTRFFGGGFAYLSVPKLELAGYLTKITQVPGA